MEYLTLGRRLERCRLHFLPRLEDCSRALVLGDGDGRFLAALLAQNTALQADAVDTSAAMLNLLEDRCQRTAEHAEARLATHHADALSYLAASSGADYDLVVTHFFLDCLTQPEVDSLACLIAPRLAPNALWVVSDFRIPSGALRLPAHAFVSLLYFAFRLLTGLQTDKLPDHASALARTGLTRVDYRRSLFGILTTELWKLG